jgi:endonuclease G
VHFINTLLILKLHFCLIKQFFMKFRNLLFFSVLALSITSCRRDLDDYNSITPEPVVPPKPYTITEDFESGKKMAYAIANANLKTGSWSFDNALIGNLAADLKNGAWSVRMKDGTLAMNADISGLNKIIIKHGKYTSNDPVSNWQLMISKDQGKTYTSITTITENNATLQTDSFSVATTVPVRFKIVNNTVNRINIDDITFKGIGDPKLTTSEPDTAPVDTTGTSKPASGRGVTKGTDAEPASGDNSNLLFGNPSNATVTNDNYLIDLGYFVESYSSTRGTPNWVSWHLDASNTTSATGRLDNFAAYSGLPTGFYAVQSNSYSGSGFDRGHNCPSADRTSSANANSSTFLMVNMIPQAPNNNQKTWANLENYLRTQVAAGNEVYIVMGNYGTGGTGSNGFANKINSDHVTVPANVWKIAVILPAGNGDVFRVSSSTRVIAVNTPNTNAIDSDWTKYLTTVDEIEKATGYDILSALPASVQQAIEARRDSGI